MEGNDLSEFLKLRALRKAPDVSMNTKAGQNQPFFSNFNKVGPGEINEYDLRGDINLPQFDDQITHQRALEQTFGEELQNQATKFVPKVGLQILETIGNIGDLENWAGAMGMADTNFQNWLSTWSKDKQQELDQAVPVYLENQDKVFDPSDSAWWTSNIGNLFESAAAFGLTGAGMGSLAGKAAGSLFAYAPRLANIINEGSQLASTLALTHAEGVMTGADVYRQVLQRNIERERGLPEGSIQLTNEEVAQMPIDPEAADAAALSVRYNYANAALNYTALSPIFKKAKYSRWMDKADDLSVLTKGAGESLEAFAKRTAEYKPTSFLNTVTKHGVEATQEALEEGINVWAQNKGMAQAGLIDEKDAELFPSLFSEQGLLSMALGAVGGVAQTGIIHALTGGGGAKDRNQEYQEKRNQVIANYGEQGVTFVKTVAAYDALKKGLAQAEANDDQEAIDFHKKQMVNTVAFNNFVNGTTSSLMNMLEEESVKTKEQLIAEKKLDEKATDEDVNDYKQTIHSTISQIKAEEQIYNKAMRLGEGISPGYAFDLFQNMSMEKGLVDLANKYKSAHFNAKLDLESKLSALDIPYKTEHGFITVKPEDEAKLEDLSERDREREMYFRYNDVKTALEKNQKERKELMSGSYRSKIQKAYKEESLKAIRQSKEKLKKSKTKVDTKAKVEKATPEEKVEVKETPLTTPPPQTELTTPPPVPAFTTPTPQPKGTELNEDVKFTTPPKVDESFKGEVEDMFRVLNDEDFEPEISEHKREYIIDKFLKVIMPKAEAEGIKTPEAMVNYMANLVGKEEVKKWYDTIINPLMVIGYSNAEFKNKTFEDVYVDSTVDDTQVPFNVLDVVNGEFYGLTDSQWKLIERDIKRAVANITSLDKDGAIRDAKGLLIYLNERLVSAYNKLAYSSRTYEEVINGRSYFIRDKGDSLDPSKNWNPNILSNSMYNEGTEIVLRVVPESEFIPYNDKDGNLVTYQSIISKNPESVPIVIEDKNGEKLGYLHTEDYINPTRVVEFLNDVDNIEENKVELSKLRRAVITSGKLKAKITSKTLGVLFTTKEEELASQRLINPKIAFALTSTNLSYSDKGNLPANVSDNLLNKGFVPGAAYYIAETQGKYVAIPLTRIKLENEAAIKSDIAKALMAYFTKDTSVADVREYNAANSNQVKDFLEQYLFLKYGLENAFADVVQESGGKVYIDFDSKSGTLVWGQSGSRVYKLYNSSKGTFLSYQELTPTGWVQRNQKVEPDKLNNIINSLIQDYVSKMTLNLSAKKLGQGDFIHRRFEGDKVVSSKMDYKDFLLQHSLTNVKDHQLPDGTVTAFHQKTIGFSTTEGVKEQPKVEEKVESKTETKKPFKSRLGFTVKKDTSQDYELSSKEEVLERIKNCVNL